MATKDYVISKFVSGRFLLTLIAGLTFSYLACKQIVPPEQSMTIIAIVITHYFTKNRNGENGHVNSNNGNNNENENEKKLPVVTIEAHKENIIK